MAPRPADPPGDGAGGALVAVAREALGDRDPGAMSIVRRYRREPSPLVRDSVRNWRTGHYDDILNGDFDLMCCPPVET